MLRRLGELLVASGKKLIAEADRRELTRRVADRIRGIGGVPLNPAGERLAKDIAAEEITNFYIEKQR